MWGFLKTYNVLTLSIFVCDLHNLKILFILHIEDLQ